MARHRHALAGFGWMNELPMASSLSNQNPTFILQALYDIPNLHGRDV
jgi:hypothetical protein